VVSHGCIAPCQNIKMYGTHPLRTRMYTLGDAIFRGLSRVYCPLPKSKLVRYAPPSYTHVHPGGRNIPGFITGVLPPAKSKLVRYAPPSHTHVHSVGHFQVNRVNIGRETGVALFYREKKKTRLSPPVKSKKNIRRGNFGKMM
jgi:hypothetical protein